MFDVISTDEESRTVTFVAKPDPRRYEWQTVKGTRYLYDKMDGLRFPEDVVKRFAEGLRDQPMCFQPAKISDAVAYVQERRPVILAMLRGEQSVPTFSDPSDEFLRTLETDRLEFVILSLDLVGSTKLATELPEAEYLNTVQTLLREISEAVPLFHGHVLKYTGDGIIAYFPSPSFITKNDLALDCALTLRRLVHDGLNPMLQDLDRSPIDVRIGLDSGEAAVVAIGSPATKQHKDLIGDVVSLACKIQSCAPAGGIALGDVTLRNLHVGWREICEEMTLGEDWTYSDRETGDRYRVHKVNFAK